MARQAGRDETAGLPGPNWARDSAHHQAHSSTNIIIQEFEHEIQLAIPTHGGGGGVTPIDSIVITTTAVGQRSKHTQKHGESLRNS